MPLCVLVTSLRSEDMVLFSTHDSYHVLKRGGHIDVLSPKHGRVWTLADICLATSTAFRPIVAPPTWLASSAFRAPL